MRSPSHFADIQWHLKECLVMDGPQPWMYFPPSMNFMILILASENQGSSPHLYAPRNLERCT